MVTVIWLFWRIQISYCKCLMPKPLKWGILKYGFCKKYFDRNEPLTSWTLFPPFFFQISADLEKNGGQKCSTGQKFIFTEVTFYKIHILDGLGFTFFRLLLLFYSYFGFLHTKCFCQQLWSRNVPKLGKLLYIHKVGYHVLCTTAVSNLAHFPVERTWESLGSRRSSTRYIFY